MSRKGSRGGDTLDIRQRRARFGVGIMGLALVVVLLLGLQARQGQAHAGLDRSEPAAETTVTVAPTEVVLYFTQEVDQSGLVVAVLGPDGTRVDLQDAAVDLCDASRTRVTVSLPDDLADGTYLVQWQTLSAEDGETDSGFFEFTLTASAATPAASPTGSPAASPAASPDAGPTAC